VCGVRGIGVSVGCGRVSRGSGVYASVSVEEGGG
jgi:hypothetical protein